MGLPLYIALLPAILWMLLGVIFFTWLRWFAVKKFVRQTAANTVKLAKWTKKTTIEITPKIILTTAMLGPFLIGFSIVAICLFFG